MQCEPYQLFGCDLSSSFPGTLFRFPLRSSTTAAASDIKKQAHTPAQLDALVTDFRASVQLALLFVRSVRRVEVYTLPPDGTPLSPYDSSLVVVALPTTPLSLLLHEFSLHPQRLRARSLLSSILLRCCPLTLLLVTPWRF